MKKRLIEGDIKYIVVASESGNTAYKVAKSLERLNVNIVCVTAYAGVKRSKDEKWPQINEKLRQKLNKLNVKIIRGNSIDFWMHP